ncbi:MAG: AmmeMemoRadiSam system protein B [Candidatus Bathyarchaeia archaeon]|nr:AmmeMemoRadiSam system protein B [Candidatus Bathyarchaeota archaeon]
MKVRRPCQAGVFYPRSREELAAEIERCFTHSLGPGKLPKTVVQGPRRIVGVLSPHAGYMYSGPVAAFSYKALAEDGEPETAVILGPNHTGMGSGVSIMNEGEWETPMGRVRVDSETADAIVKASRIIDVDDEAHILEHSIEVQLPFLQYLYDGRVKIVPLCMMMQDMETSMEVGSAIFEASKGRNITVIASSDMTHYEPQRSAERKDRIALDMIESLNVEGLYRAIEGENISMCGYGPVAALMHYARTSGVERASIEAYKTSGDVTGDFGAVVGYASAVFRR